MAAYGKTDIIEQIAAESGISKAQAGVAFASFENTVKGLKKGEKIVIPGFIKFESKSIPAKSGVTKLGGTEKKWSTPAHYAVKAKVTFK
jgi:nucleoid DNA-binding protein